ncbi:MAG: alpha/beta fold hydrolase [Pseudomonadota bacterium]
MDASSDMRPMVVLLHGLGRTPASMWLLARRISNGGFTVARLGYDSTRQSVSTSIAEVRRRLGQLCSGPVHLVGHSLGGLIAATILREPDGIQVARIVQIGSPNLGSPLAARLGGAWPARRLCGPALAELSLVSALPEPEARIGAIAGTFGPPGTGLRAPHDGGVSLRSAWAGAGSRAAVPVIHTLLPLSPEVARLTVQFLNHGTFGSAR